MGAYEIYFGKQLLPQAPETLEIKINNQNSTLTLSDGAEINILKAPGLSDVTFHAVLPIAKYSWANYGGATDQVKFLNMFEELKVNKSVFDFIVLRNRGDFKTHKNALYSTRMRVSLEDYTITEAHENGGDVDVEVNLKQFRSYNITLGFNSQKQQIKSNTQVNATVKIVTQNGDTLNKICTRYYEIDNAVQGRAKRAVLNANKNVLSSYNIRESSGVMIGSLTPLRPGTTLLLPAVL